MVSVMVSKDSRLLLFTAKYTVLYTFEHSVSDVFCIVPANMFHKTIYTHYYIG